ncbi:MAG: nuoN [Pseudonocardiales bacterium]|nr:nuoN [Pseudonocardiales bacterium]
MLALSVPVASVTAPSISYYALSPILIVLGTAMLGVLAEAFVPREQRYYAQVGLSIAGLVASLVAIGIIHNTSTLTSSGALAIDGFTLFLQGTIVVLSILSIMLIAERSVDTGSAVVAQAAVVAGSPADRRLATSTQVQTEIFPLAMFAISGMLIFPAANNLLLMFVALEVLSLPLYLMAGLARRRRLLSQEAAMKYFLLGAFASAFFLYGLALLYGYAGTVDLPGILATQTGKSDVLLYLGFGLLIVGLLFKAGIAPFHSWTPDVYQGSPTPVTAFMASCTKIAAFGAIARVLYVGFYGAQWNWRPIIWAVAIASMVVGAIFGLTQIDIKRILAYSSIAHAGFILVGLVALTKDGLSATLFYLLAYGFTTIAAFGLVTLVRDADGEATHLSQWSGLAKKSPFVATVMTILLLGLAGIPLTSGFTSKFVVFRAAYHTAGPLVVIALVSSAVAAFFYLRIVVMMFFADPPENSPTIAVPSGLTTIAITIGTAVTIVLGIVPQPLLDLASKAAILRG